MTTKAKIKRPRLRAAARKLAVKLEEQHINDADVVAIGVRATARAIVDDIEPGALYWRAPIQYVIEQAAPRVAKQFNVPADQIDELRAYLLAGVNEFFIALMGEFDAKHFAAWSAAMLATERGESATHS